MLNILVLLKKFKEIIFSNTFFPINNLTQSQIKTWVMKEISLWDATYIVFHSRTFVAIMWVFNSCFLTWSQNIHNKIVSNCFPEYIASGLHSHLVFFIYIFQFDVKQKWKTTSRNIKLINEEIIERDELFKSILRTS